MNTPFRDYVTDPNINQVTNGVAVRMAVLYLLSGGKPELAESAKGGGGR